jgi:hypothetical protein
LKNKAGSPSEVLLSDLPIFLDIALWLLAVGLVVYRS